jgi:hypothetical protein
MKKSVAAIHKAEPSASIHNPVTSTSSTPVTWTAPQVVCHPSANNLVLAKTPG